MSSRFVAVAVAALLAVAVPTAAVTVADTGDDEIEWDGPEISLAPHDGPNGKYATVEDGELAVAFERLNDDARTTADDVFTIEATGDDAVEVWVTVETEGVDVYRSDGPRSPIGEDDPVTLQPGESVDVGFEVDTGESIPESSAVTVHAEADDDPTPDPTETPSAPSGDAEFVVTDLSAPGTVSVGQTATVAATVENVGDAEGTYVAALEVDGTVVDRVSVTVPAGETKTVTFQRPFDRVGEYELAVGEQRRTISVIESDGETAEFDVTDPRIGDDEIERGSSTEISVTVENTGTAAGETTVELVVGGTVVDEQTVTLAAGETTTVTFEWSFEETGIYSVGIGGLDAGDVTVLAGAEADGRLLSSSLQTAAAGPVLLLILLLVLGWRYRSG